MAPPFKPKFLPPNESAAASLSAPSSTPRLPQQSYEVSQPSERTLRSLTSPPGDLASAASTLKSALETTDSNSSSDRLSNLRFTYRKRVSKLRRLLRERDAIEAAARDGTDTEPNPRLATLEHELSDTIESRNRLGREIDKLLGSELSEPDEDLVSTPKAVDPVGPLTFDSFVTQRPQVS